MYSGHNHYHILAPKKCCIKCLQMKKTEANVKLLLLTATL